MKLPIVGPAYKHPSIDVNNQKCVNLFLMSSGEGGRGQNVLVPTTGLSIFKDLGTDPIRCMGAVGDNVYVVVGANVYRLYINIFTKIVDLALLIGTMSTSIGTVYMDANPTQVVWVDGTSTGYIYTIGTNVFGTINSFDADFPGGGQVKFIDSYFVVNKPNTSEFYFSAPNDGKSWNPLDFAKAESGTDNIIGLGVTKGELWVIGSSTIEIWYDAGNASPGSPFSPRKGLEIQGGCGAPDSISQIDDLLIWLDNRGYVVQSSLSPYFRDNNTGYALQIISDEAITTEILSYSRRDDAIACTYNDRGHLMYQISFPTEKKTWVFDYTTKKWHERTFFNSFVSEEEHHLVQFSCEFLNLNIVAGVRNGKIYLQDSSYLDDAGENIRRTRVTSPIYDEEEYRQVGVYCVELRMETGRASSTGSGSDPHISLRYSNNGGHTWSDFMDRSIGLVGEYAKPIIWNMLGTAREWVFELTFSEPVHFSIVDAVINGKTEEILSTAPINVEQFTTKAFKSNVMEEKVLEEFLDPALFATTKIRDRNG